jgi:hypothetical protein
MGTVGPALRWHPGAGLSVGTGRDQTPWLVLLWRTSHGAGDDVARVAPILQMPETDERELVEGAMREWRRSRSRSSK